MFQQDMVGKLACMCGMQVEALYLHVSGLVSHVFLAWDKIYILVCKQIFP